MLATELKARESETIKAIQGPSIMIVTGGEGTLKAGGNEYQVQEGFVFFIGYDTETELIVGDGLETHIAFCEAYAGSGVAIYD